MKHKFQVTPSKTVMGALSLALVAFTVSACAPKAPDPVIGEVGTLYNDGMDQLEARKWGEAIHTFEELERQHPYSGWATRAQMMTAFAQYRAGNYDEAEVTIDRFIQLHPGHDDLDYMYYLKAQVYYNRISDVTRDQGFTRKALRAYEEVVRRFPDSPYTRDARLKVTLCRDHLAAQDMNVGRFYQKQGRYNAALTRFQRVISEYQGTQQVPEALFRLTESYLALGLQEQAQRAAAVLGYNYPQSPWYRDAYNILKGKNLEVEKNWRDDLNESLDKLF